MMLQIQDTLVTLDLAEEFFCCDLDRCLGACCIEGDAGAPVTLDEIGKLEEVFPLVASDMAPRSRDQRRGLSRRGRRDGDHPSGRFGLRVLHLRQRGSMPLRHRQGIPRGARRLAQTSLLCLISGKAQEIQGFHCGELPSLGDMQARGGERTPPGHPALPVSGRASD